MEDGKKLKFPDQFYWGAATSSHQVEGGNYNDWSEWEKENASRLAEEAKSGWRPWQREKFPEMLKPENYISGRAGDHYNKFEEDFNVAQSMGHNAHRLSVEWSRIEPEQGRFDEYEIEHYRQVVSSLRQKNIEPFVTLYHWTVPVWFAEKGGWLHKDAPKHFERFAKRMAEALPDVKFWITINEPNIYTSNSFLRGNWPPQYRNIFKYFKVLRQLADAHKKAYRVIKNMNSDRQVGISKHNIYFEKIPFLNYFWNHKFLKQIDGFQDFIGLNYYFHSKLGGNKNESVSDLGWEIFPEGIYHVLKDLKKYNLPVYITENGLADASDIKRTKFITDTLRYVHKAISDGVDVRGYMHWSLLDNFEWDKGFWPRFGLVEIDYNTLERKVRKSALEYAKICKSNELDLST